MPEISRFLGIVITMYFEDHAPPHFHARDGSYRINVAIADGAREGMFPPGALGLVQEWRTLRAEELSENWQRAQDLKPLGRIEGLS